MHNGITGDFPDQTATRQAGALNGRRNDTL